MKWSRKRNYRKYNVFLTLRLTLTISFFITITVIPLTSILSYTSSSLITIKERRFEGNEGTRITTNLNDTFWEKGPPLPINDTGYAHAYKGKIYFVGGKAVQKYDPWKEQWTVIKQEGLGYHPFSGDSALIGDRIYMVHGWTDRNTTYYDISSNSLESFSHPQKMRLDVAVAAVDDILYVSGGWISGGSAVRTVEAYNPKTDKWSSVQSMSTTRKQHEMVAAGGFLYVIGGYSGSGYRTRTKTVEKYDPSTDEWEYLEDVPAYYTQHGSTTTHDESIIISSIKRSTHVYNSSEEKWVLGPRYPEHSGIIYWANSLTFFNGKVYSIGLRDSPGNYYNSVWITKISEPTESEPQSSSFGSLTFIFSLIILVLFVNKCLRSNEKT
ncbi:MAG: Kelch repeat-containing protein [Promethearchaeota archaeon]